MPFSIVAQLHRCIQSASGAYKADVMNVLVVEDDRKIASFVKKGLKERGFTVSVCSNGDEGFARATQEPFDVVVLDIMLPGSDGLSVLRRLREERTAVPVILLTARSSLNERVEGLNLGADDYLTKPFYLEELVARIHAVTRRAPGEQLNMMQAGDLVVNLITREVRVGKEKVRLTVREFALLEMLMRSAGRVLTRTQLLDRIWGYDFDPETNLVDVYVRRLRSKVDVRREAPLIETIRGVGYQFVNREAE
jgi:two-component system OmpR family response regulator